MTTIRYHTSLTDTTYIPTTLYSCKLPPGYSAHLHAYRCALACCTHVRSFTPLGDSSAVCRGWELRAPDAPRGSDGGHSQGWAGSCCSADPESAGSRDPSLRRRGLGEGNGGESRGMGRGGGGERESGGAVRGQGRGATVCAV